MRELLQKLVECLREDKWRIARTVEIQAVVYDPTYGPRETALSIEVLDFDALLESIDRFGQQLRDEAASR